VKHEVTTMKKMTRFAFLAAAAMVSAVPALADSYTLSLMTPTVSLAAGSTYTFTGTITADAGNGADLSLIGASANGDDPLIFDTTDFYNDTPTTLGAGQSYMGDLFTVTLPSTITAGPYVGYLNVELDDAAGNALIEPAKVTVNATSAVAATPEPGSWALLGTGLVAVGMLRRRFAARLG
jgi:hypothetical protein